MHNTGKERILNGFTLAALCSFGSSEEAAAREKSEEEWAKKCCCAAGTACCCFVGCLVGSSMGDLCITPYLAIETEPCLPLFCGCLWGGIPMHAEHAAAKIRTQQRESGESASRGHRID